MELRGQDKDIGMPNSTGYNPPNRESTSKLSSASIISTVGERRRDESGRVILNPSTTLDHEHLHHHHHHHPHQFNPQQQRQIEGRDQNPDPDPAPISVSGATTSIPIASGSNSKSPLLPQPAPPVAPPTNSSTATTIRYRDCLKNHAASKGGHAVDGCGEFMPSGEEGTQEALKCAACDCHRNFHRKEIDGESQYNANCYYSTTYNYPNKNSSRRNTIPPPQFPPPFPPPPPSSHQYCPQKYLHGLSTSPLAGRVQPMMMAFAGGVPADSSSEDLNVFDQSNVGMQLPSAQQPSYPLSKKRFRTKFSQEQKGKMLEFAEKLEWRIQKQDEQEVQQFCSEVGVKRQVFKVWMHNNKHAMKKKQ